MQLCKGKTEAAVISSGGSDGAISTLERWHRQLRQDGKVWIPCTGSTVGYQGLSVMSSEKSHETENKEDELGVKCAP